MTEKEIRDAITELNAASWAGIMSQDKPHVKHMITLSAVRLAIAALRLRLWHKIEDLDKDEPETNLLCRFSDGTIETFPTESIADWNRISPIKATHYQYLPDFTEEPCTGCKKNSQAFCPLMNGTGCFDYLKDQFGIDLRGDKP